MTVVADSLDNESDVQPTDEARQHAQDMNLRRVAMYASAITLVGYGLCQVFRLVQNVVVSRFVAPDIFGVFTMLNICLQGLFMFSDLGVGPSIVQHKDGDKREFLNTAWTIQIVRSCILWAVTCLVAFPFAHFYNNSAYLWLLPLTGFAAMLDGLTSTTVFTAQRRLLVGRLVALDVAAQLLGSIAACVWAYHYPTPVALLSASLVAMGFRMVVSHFLIRGSIPNRLCWDQKAFDDVFAFGKWILISAVVAFFAMQVDKLMLGKLITETQLGLYGVAIAISNLPVVLMQKICANVLHPWLAEYQRDSGDRMRAQFRTVRGTLLMIALFLVMGVYACSTTFFEVVYDPSYHGAGAIAKMLAVSVWISAVTATVVRVVFVIGDSRVLATSSLVKFVATGIVSLFCFLQWGLPGFIAGLVIGNVLGYFVLLYSLRSHQLGCLWQDVRYSALFLVMALAVDYGGTYVNRMLLTLPSVADVSLPMISEKASIGELGVSVTVCLMAAVLVAYKGLQLSADRKMSAEKISKV